MSAVCHSHCANNIIVTLFNVIKQVITVKTALKQYTLLSFHAQL